MEIEIQMAESEYNIEGTDRQKGKTIERIVKKALTELGAEKIYNLEGLKKQVNLGDLAIEKEGKLINIEVKTSHNWQGKDKQAIDIYYFKYNRKYGLLPYKQEKSTNSWKGWLYFGDTDWLVTYSPTSTKMYIITKFNKLKKQLIEETEEYINKLPKCELTWYENWNKNYINKYLEGSVKQDKSNKNEKILKESLVVNLELSKESLNYYGLDLLEFDIKINIIESKRKRKAPNTTAIVEGTF